MGNLFSLKNIIFRLGCGRFPKNLDRVTWHEGHFWTEAQAALTDSQESQGPGEGCALEQ